MALHYWLPCGHFIEWALMILITKHVRFAKDDPKWYTRMFPRRQSLKAKYQSIIIETDINTLRPRQNDRHFPDDILKCMFLNENIWILLKCLVKFVPNVAIDNILSLVQIMAWRRPGSKPLSETIMVNSLTHKCVTRPQWVKRFSLMIVNTGIEGLRQSNN